MPISKSINFLPDYLNSVANRRFLGSTLDLLVSEPQIARFDGYIGRTYFNGRALAGNYLLENTPVRQAYQLESSFVTRDQNNQVTDTYNFIDVLNSCANKNAVTSAWNRLLSSNMYSWKGFNDLDKLVNFQNYLWMSKTDAAWYWQNSINITTVSGMAATEIIGSTNYVDKNNVSLFDGMRVQFTNDSGAYASGSYIVCGVGYGINLIPDSYFIYPNFSIQQNNPPDYITVNPNAADKNIWSRTNFWVHKNTVDYIITTLTAQYPSFVVPTSFTPANRPIIEFDSLSLFDINSFGIDPVTYFDSVTPNAINNIQGTTHYAVDGYQLNDGDSVIFNGDTNSAVRSNVYNVNFIDTTTTSQTVRLYPVQAVSTVNVVLAGLQVIDNYITQPGDRVLLVEQTNVQENGIYVVSTGNWVLASDYAAEQNKNIPLGVFVLYGTYYKETYFVYTPSANNPANYFISGKLIGTQDGINKVFVIPHLAYPDTLLVWDNSPLVPNVGYTTSVTSAGETIVTFTNPPNDTSALYYQCQTIYAPATILPYAGIPNGIINNINNTFTINQVLDLKTLIVWNNFPLVQGVGYTASVSANQTTIVLANAPIVGESALYVQGYNVNSSVVAAIKSGKPSQTPDGTITEFSIGEIPDSSTILFWRNFPLIPGVGYNLSGSNVILNEPPVSSDALYYVYLPSNWEQTSAPIIQLSVREAVQNNTNTIILSGNTYAASAVNFDNAVWELSTQNKSSLNQAPLFDVFNASNNSLSTLSSSNFTGTTLFSYALGTGTNDTVLGFPLQFGVIGNINDVVFNNTYYTDTYSILGSTNLNILGNVIHYVNPLTNVIENYSPWNYVKASNKIYQNLTFTGTSNISISGTIYNNTITPQSVLVFIDGSQIFSNSFTASANNGKIIISINPSVVSAESEILVKILSNQPLAGAIYDVPVAFDHNPLGQIAITYNIADIRSHLTELAQNSGISNRIVDAGQSPYNSVMGTIMVPESSALLASLLLCNKDLDIDDSLRAAEDDYILFKQRFINTASQITSLQSMPVKDAVDTILRSVASNSSIDQPWNTSDMAFWGGTRNTIVINNNFLSTFNLTNTYNWNSANDLHLYIYLNGKQLLLNYDYTVSGTTLSVSSVMNIGDILDIYEISSTVGSFIPATPTKLGLYNAYKPEIYTDNSYQTPRRVLRGHDGSITACYNDYRDALLLDFEMRVFNNLKVNNQLWSDILNQTVPTYGRWRSLNSSTNLDIQPYSTNEILSIEQQFYYEWIAKNNIIGSTNYFNQSDLFTWNWSGSLDQLPAPNTLPGYWRGIYRSFYDTDNIANFPWEALNLSQKPTWWDTLYGPSPYTGGNIPMWSDISNGIINDTTGVRYSTNGPKQYGSTTLLNMLPVDEGGNLLDPNDSVVQTVNTDVIQNNFVFGDGGPEETAWRRSSSFPFANVRRQILQNPVFVLGTTWDTNKYLPSATLDQFLYNNALFTSSQITLNGVDSNGSQRTNGIINYSIEYLTRNGKNATTLRAILNQTSVNLVYSLGGYTNANDLTVYASPNNPTDVGAAELISIEDFSVYLSSGIPTGTLNYSGIIVSTNGIENQFIVSGYNASDPYFTINVANNIGPYAPITVGSNTYRYPTSFIGSTIQIPYNSIFYSIQDVINFIAGYESYLTTNGLVFDVDPSQSKTGWNDAAIQFIKWSYTTWPVDNLSISLNPSASIITYNTNGGTLADLSDPNISTVLDPNGNFVDNKYLDVLREGNTVTITHQGGGVFACVASDVISFEHKIVFDNVSAFNDTIYDPISYIRQARLKISGQKSANWNGTLDSAGFILVTNAVDQWIPNKDYLFGTLVMWKNQYYVAVSDVIGSQNFPYSAFRPVNVNLSESMLPNLSLKAKDYKHSYDVNYRPFMNDLVRLKNNTIGYVERDWLSGLDIDSNAQINFYRGWIKQKGSLNSLSSYSRSISPLSTQLSVNEEYAMKVGVYGSDSRTGYGDISLPPSAVTTTPLVVRFMTTVDPTDTTSVQITPTSLYEKSPNWINNFGQAYGTLATPSSSFANAGPVIPQELIDFAKSKCPTLDNNDTNALFYNSIYDLPASSEQSTIIDIASNGGIFWFSNNPLYGSSNNWDVWKFNSVPTGIAQIATLGGNLLSFNLSTDIGATSNSIAIINYVDNTSNVSITSALPIVSYEINPSFIGNIAVISNLIVDASTLNLHSQSITYPGLVTTGDIYVLSSLRFNSIGESVISGQSPIFVDKDQNGPAYYTYTEPFAAPYQRPTINNAIPIESIAYDPENLIVWTGKPYLYSNTGIIETRILSESRNSSGIVSAITENTIYQIQPTNPYTRFLGNTIVSCNSFSFATANGQSSDQIYINQIGNDKIPKINQIISGEIDNNPYNINDIAISDDGTWLYVSTSTNKIGVFMSYTNPYSTNIAVPSANASISSNTIITSGVTIPDAYSINITVINNATFQARTLIPNLEYTVSSNVITIIPTLATFNIGTSGYTTTITSVPTYYKFVGSINGATSGVASISSFGQAIDTNEDGSILVVSAPQSGNGQVVYYARIVENQYLSVGGSTVSTVNNINPVSSVMINGAITTNYSVSYSSIGATITFGTPLANNSTVSITGLCFPIVQVISAPNPYDRDFGASLAVKNGKLTVGSPNTHANHISPRGEVYVYALDTNISSQKIISIASLNFNNTKFMMNGWYIQGTTLQSLITNINNSSNYTGVSAYVSGGNLILAINNSINTSGIIILGE